MECALDGIVNVMGSCDVVTSVDIKTEVPLQFIAQVIALGWVGGVTLSKDQQPPKAHERGCHLPDIGPK